MNRAEDRVDAVAGRVAAALSTLDAQAWQVSDDAGRVQLRSASGDRLGMHIRSYGPRAGRLIVRCCDPDDARDVPAIPELTTQVTVDPDRPAEGIAADLHRRLLTAYRQVRPTARAWRIAADALESAEGAIVDEAAQHLAVLPGTITTAAARDRPALALTTEHPHWGALTSLRISEVCLALEPYLTDRASNRGRQPLYADVQLRVHPRLLPALARAIAEVAITTDLDAVPAHQCPHPHQEACRHGHDPDEDRADPRI